MTRALAIALFIFLLATGLIFVISDNYRAGMVVASPAATTPAAAPATVAVAPTSFSATGTIDYYPNNTGAMVPYLVYALPSGTMATKALIYCDVPAGHYSGSVHIEGALEESSVCVDSITAA